ncbi:Adenine-specific DNA methylase, contains a Zn-ribbon domain [Micromonospora citrea]|uniref:Adenine-specific DNA methylase, contains a Zn-ribbon domain n=1 Tax=Micromonospora citrea TaxID=47855 RepID=A0A1C6VW42_9ACTN|nr:DUF1156 domain-containing protein [Micromonospora citrea]SCL70417.1 Adenine-specific DNA methylase, contains a Zn-ribbon domain [Micromonospora citrea]
MSTGSSSNRVLIEDWLPVAELSIESRRERGAVHALPPLSFLHVWWARRPLVASAAVVLGGLLPTWSQELASAISSEHLKDSSAYRAWFRRLIGIWGDPITAQRAADHAKASGVPLQDNPFTYRQAYRNPIPLADIELLHKVLAHTWGDLPQVADPTAGGGSIPFASARLGLPTYANDLNGVAASVLAAGVKLAAERGLDIAEDLDRWGKVLVKRVTDRLKPYFPSGRGEQVANFIWVNAIACPRTGRLIPLLPDKWLRKTPGFEVAVEAVTTTEDGTDLREPTFVVVQGNAVDRHDAGQGFIARGAALSPYSGMVVDGEYVKAEAQAGRMTQLLYAVAFRDHKGKRSFRSPTPADLDAIASASKELARVRREWEANGYLPTEDIAEGNYDRGHRMYGMFRWADLFTDRQLLVHGTFAEEFAKLAREVRSVAPNNADAVLHVLAMMQGKALNYNSRLCSWHTPKQTMRSVFEKHNFSFKWTFAEFEGATELYPWCLDQAIRTYEGVASLLANTGIDPIDGKTRLHREVTVTQGSAGALSLPDRSIAHVCMDPPYYDNVMYAELSDFFYVWEKRTIGRIMPEFFAGDLADKDNEAVANVARFAHMGKRTRVLADADYEAKMTAIFSEARRVLRDDGVLTVMFTHKRAEAWDTLGMGLLKAGFTIEASWPVNTEAEHSLHQSGVNSAASTIMLVCRKRSLQAATAVDVYLEDIEGEVRQVARESVERFRADGIDGVDLLLSAYGPTLGVVSQHWPVHSSEADESGRARLLRPEEALGIARSEIVRVQRARLVGHPIEFDPLTDFVVAFWDVVKDDTATFDEGRRLALAVGGLDIDELQRSKIVEKKAGTVRLLSPKERVRPRAGDEELPGVRPQAASFGSLIDAVHTVCLVADEDGLAHAKAIMDRVGLSKDSRFVAAVQALVNAVPRVKAKGAFVLPLAGSLDRLVTAYLPQVTVPHDPAKKETLVQGDMLADLLA